jgi:hypothetical protein
MEPQAHPDPFADAASHGIQRVIQIASSAATGAQVLAYLKKDRTKTHAQTDEQHRRAQAAQMRAERAAARASLAATNPNWMKNADLGQAAHAWGLSMPYADPATPWYEPTGAATMRRAEQRLRVLHPTAMARYDRLRSEGMEPPEAMRQAAPMFCYPPRAHDPPYTPPPRSLTASRPEPGRGQEPPARTPQPWKQDFPLPIGQVLAATASKDSAVPTGTQPVAAADRAARRNGSQP